MPYKSGPVFTGFLVILATLFSAVTIALPVWSLRDFYFFWPPLVVSREIYGANPFIECPVIADYLRRRTSPNDRVAVIGSEPEIFFYAQRKSATGYIYVYSLMESHPDVHRMQQEMIREIEAAKPEYLVIVNVPTSWMMNRNSDPSILDWANRYAKTYFRPVGLIDILYDAPTSYKWGDQIAGARPRSNCHLWVFQRKP
jgi:hypothetical protein